MFRQSGTFRENQEVQERVMDNLDLERERGITISAKNCSVHWGSTKINIIDTPGHADFGGEVERALMMVQGAVLLVDASEGPLPQTRFVVSKALRAGLKMVVVINKIDRKDARPKEVLDEIYNLFIDLDATEDQLDFPVLYAVGREGLASKDLDQPGTDLSPLFEAILSEIPPPAYHPGEPFQMLVLNLGYSDYLGRLAIGRVVEGEAQQNERLVCLGAGGVSTELRVTKLQIYEGIRYQEVETAKPGEIVILSGADEVAIGDTICTTSAPKALPRVTVDEPTIAMKFTTNTSPFAGEDGKFLQSAKIRERLVKETLQNVALQVQDTDDPDTFVMRGRGEFQMAIIIETMRREGYELSVGRPEVITKVQGEKVLEPIEHVYIDCEEQYVGIINERLSRRRGRMLNLINHGYGRVRLEYSIPSRGLIGYRSQFLTDTRGTGLMSSYLKGYEPYRGDFEARTTGSIVSDRQGSAVPYAIFHLEPRGRLFIQPGDPVYEGMVVGEHSRDNDLDVNPCRTKKLTNMRAAGRDENIILTPVVPMTLEQAIEYIKSDELVEITPKAIRVRKKKLKAFERRTLRAGA